MGARLWIVATLLAAGAGGCCTTSDDVVVFERTREDAGRSCEEICAETIIPFSEKSTYELVDCEEGFSEDDEPAVLCDFEITHCETELH